MIGFALDMDGTVYLGEQPIPGAKEFINSLNRAGVPFRFITNNSSHPRSFYADRLSRMGFDVKSEQILTSAVATASFLNAHRNGKRVFAIATPEVSKELSELGVDLVDSSENPDIVLLTFDTTIDYRKLNHGYHCLRAGAELVATHPDDLCPTETGYDVDIGPFIRLYESMTGCKATVVGKPNRLMLDMAALEMGVTPDSVIMVGDRLTTDIRMASDAGIRSILVLSGETDLSLLNDSSIKPTFVADSVADLRVSDYVRTGIGPTGADPSGPICYNRMA